MHLKFILALYVRGRNCYPHFTGGEAETELRLRKNGWHELICSGFSAIRTYIHLYTCVHIYVYMASQVVLRVKNPPAKAGDARNADSTLGQRRSPGGGNGSPFQYSSLENSMDRGAFFFFFFSVKSLEECHLTTPRVFARIIIVCPLFHILMHF